MNAVLISNYFETDGDDQTLEIAVEIETIPPIGFEFGFQIPHIDRIEGHLALVVTGYYGRMTRRFDKKFTSDPIEVHVKPGPNSEEGMDYEQVKKYLDRRVPIEENVLEENMYRFMNRVYKKGMNFSQSFLGCIPRWRTAPFSWTRGECTFGEMTVRQFIEQGLNNPDFRLRGYGKKIRGYIEAELRHLKIIP